MKRPLRTASRRFGHFAGTFDSLWLAPFSRFGKEPAHRAPALRAWQLLHLRSPTSDHLTPQSSGTSLGDRTLQLPEARGRITLVKTAIFVPGARARRYACPYNGPRDSALDGMAVHFFLLVSEQQQNPLSLPHSYSANSKGRRAREHHPLGDVDLQRTAAQHEGQQGYVKESTNRPKSGLTRT